MPHILALFVLAIVLVSCQRAANPKSTDTFNTTQPDTRDEAIINSHFHAAYLGMDDQTYLETVLSEMTAHNIEASVLHIYEPSDLEDWVDRAPGRFLAGPAFPCWENQDGELHACNWNGSAWPDLAWMRQNYETGRMHVMGEMFFVYAGIAPNDDRMLPYWALAEELKIPVGVHINRGPPANSPSRPSGCCPNFSAEFGNPALLRPVLAEHPNLKIWLQHAGFPAMPVFDNIDYLEETYALLADFPNVYVDMSALNAAAPPHVHAAAVQGFIDRGFADRIMMGTDNWEAAPIIDRYETFEFLNPQQKRAILHDNAARFFGLD